VRVRSCSELETLRQLLRRVTAPLRARLTFVLVAFVLRVLVHVPTALVCAAGCVCVPQACRIDRAYIMSTGAFVPSLRRSMCSTPSHSHGNVHVVTIAFINLITCAFDALS